MHADAAPAPLPADRADISRRILLGTITALIVARPLVAGEDPGRLHSPESASGVLLNLLWLIAVLGGAVWLARGRRPLRLGGWLPLGLHVITALLLFGTAVVSCYRHPGWLIAWEWATLALSFLLVRGVVSDSEPASDSGGRLLAAIMATGVTLAVYALYQVLAETTGLPPPELPPESAAVLPPGADYLGPTAEPGTATCRATLQRPDTLVALLILILPLVVAFGLSARRSRAR